MWTRRVLLASVIAAAAMSLPRHVPAGNSGQSAQASQGFAMTAYR